MECEIKSLRIVLQGITRSEGKWKAFIDFCDKVMKKKKNRERERGANEGKVNRGDR